MRRRKICGRGIISFFCLLTGLLLLLYPRIRSALNRYETSSQAETYRNLVDEQDDSARDNMWNAACQYNLELTRNTVVLTDPFVSGQEKETSVYESVLAVGEDGLMGFVEIPVIDVYLPVYHGTGEDVLEKGIGHLEGSSLPVGGEDTHAVLSGHTGLGRAKLFTDLDEMEKGDVFRLHILDRVLTYKVTEISVVLPSDIRGLMIRPGKDLCTLVTCTPYGVNSHRLLVTGEREESPADNEGSRAGERGDDTTGSDRLKRRLIWITGLSLGLVLILYPVFSGVRFRHQSEKYISDQTRPGEMGNMGEEKGSIGDTVENGAGFRKEAEDYNASLLLYGQDGIGNPAEADKLPLLAEETEECGMGVVEIPVMDVRMPLFFGTSDLHLSRGAAILEGTSLPLGEDSSNTVVAGHRGYRGIPYFRDIERLKEGDAVYLTTPWDSFLYRVTEIQVIDPSDTEALAIQPGENLLTLLTCHPYLSGGKYRYVVYCMRDNGWTGKDDRGQETENETNVLLQWKESPDSRKLIFGEKVFRFLGICGIVVLFFVQIRRERRGVCET